MGTLTDRQRFCLVCLVTLVLLNRYHFSSLDTSQTHPAEDHSPLVYDLARRDPNLAFSVGTITPSEIPVVVPAIATPAIAMLIGGLAAGHLRLSSWGHCASQFFSAGMILAVCGGLMKELTESGSAAAFCLSAGFGAGVATMVLVKRIAVDGDVQSDSPSPVKAFPWSYILAVAIDSLVDGLLLGMVGVETPREVLMMAAATAIEMGALGLSCSVALLTRSKLSRFSCVIGMPIILVAGGCIGAFAASALRRFPLAYTFMLAYGIAALLYLVLQELLVEANERREEVDSSGCTSYCLFLGYLFVLVIDTVQAHE